MKFSVRAICFTGMFAAVTAVLSILAIPTPWGVPFTLQTFSVALCGYVLGWKYGTASTALYVLLGLVGVPVYAGMKAGLGVLFGPTGGYLFGFILMTLLCGLAQECFDKAKRRLPAAGLLISISVLGLACCHIPGIIQLKFVMDMEWGAAAMAGSVPYLLKDVLSVAGAYLVAIGVRKGLAAADISFFYSQSGNRSQ